MITNQIYGGGKENLDRELNTQDTLLETLKTDIEALPSASGGGEPEYIEIDVSNSTTGTLTKEQLETLKASNLNYVRCKVSRIPMENYSFTNIIEMRLLFTRTLTNDGVVTNTNMYSSTNYNDGMTLSLDMDTGVYEISAQSIQPSIDYYTTIQIDNWDSTTKSVIYSGTLTDNDVKVANENTYSSQVRFNFSDCTLRFADFNNGIVIYTGVANGKYYEAKLDITNKTWTLSEKSMLQEYIYKSVTYDNTTLGAHMYEIKGMLNNENGGTLVKIGFKVGTASLVTNAYSIVTDLTNPTNPVCSGYSAQALGAGKYYEFIPASITSSNTWTLNGSVGNFADNKMSSIIVSNATIAMANGTYTLSAICSDSVNNSSAADNGFTVRQFGFSGLNIGALTLEHLTIVYMEQNNA